jgi:hypothetical protein
MINVFESNDFEYGHRRMLEKMEFEVAGRMVSSPGVG